MVGRKRKESRSSQSETFVSDFLQSTCTPQTTKAHTKETSPEVNPIIAEDDFLFLFLL